MYINARDKVKLYYTVNPDHLGYGTKTEWKPLTQKPDAVGTVMSIKKIWNVLKAKAGLNSGTVYSMRLYIGSDQISFDEIDKAEEMRKKENARSKK